MVLCPAAELGQALDPQVAGSGAVVVGDGLAGAAVVALLFVRDPQGPAGRVLDDGRILPLP